MTCRRYKYVRPIILTYSESYNVFRMCSMSGNVTCCLYYLLCVSCYATPVILRHIKLFVFTTGDFTFLCLTHACVLVFTTGLFVVQVLYVFVICNLYQLPFILVYSNACHTVGGNANGVVSTLTTLFPSIICASHSSFSVASCATQPEFGRRNWRRA